MRYLIVMIVLLFTPPAQAAVARCGTDAFGNEVCMDGHGVVTSAPGRHAKSRTGGKDGSAVEGKAGETGKQSSLDAEPGMRCGTDPFGNTVCASVPTRPEE